MQEGIHDAQALLAAEPLSRFVLRLYGPYRMRIAGKARARTDMTWVLNHVPQDLFGAIEGLVFINEPNLEGHHEGPHPSGSWHTADAYQDIDRWIQSYVAEFRILLRSVPWSPALLGPALSPNVRPEGLSILESYQILRESLVALDGLAVHVYGPLADLENGAGRLTALVHAFRELELAPRRVIVSECNQVNFADLCNFAGQFPEVEGLFWFGFEMNHEHSKYDLRPPYSDGLKEYLAAQGGQCECDGTADLVEIIGGVPVCFGFLTEYRRRGRHDGIPLSPEMHSGRKAIQAFSSGAIYIWDGSRVHVLCDTV